MQRNFRPELSTADWHTGNAKQSIGVSLLAVTFQASNQIEVSLSGLTDTQRTALGFAEALHHHVCTSASSSELASKVDVPQ